MGDPANGEYIARIGALFCIDGIPAFTYKVVEGISNDFVHFAILFCLTCVCFICLGIIINAGGVSHSLSAVVAALQRGQHHDEYVDSQHPLCGFAVEVL